MCSKELSQSIDQITVFVNPLPDDKILDSFKLKEFADNDFRYDENGRKLSKRVENTVGKGEIARYEQFLHFPQCFQKACFQGASKGVIVWEWVKIVYILDCMGEVKFLEQKLSENIVGKGENSGNQHFILFLQCFLLCQSIIGFILENGKFSSV